MAKAWLDPDNFGKGPGYHTLSDDNSKGSTISTMSKSCGGSGRSGSKRSSYISNNSLNPEKGALMHRLNFTLVHWPGTAECDRHGNSWPCRLHWWACGNKKQKNVAHCEECNVTLCTGLCYKLFHTVWDLPAEKEHIRKMLNEKDTAGEKM